MSFFDSIERLQAKPRPVRMRILAVLVASAMAVILFVWVANLRATLRAEETAARDSIQPFVVLRDIIQDGFRSARDQLNAVFYFK